MIFTDINEVIGIIQANLTVPEWISEARKYHEDLEA